MENKFDNQENSNINIREELEKYLVHWRWFLISVFITVALAFVYLRYSQKIYSIGTSIIVKDEKRGGGIASEMAAFADLGMFSGGKSNVENETQVLQSRSLAEKTVRRLQLNISHINNDRFVKSDLYNNSPISINFVERVFDFDDVEYSFYIKDRTDTTFLLLDEEEKELGTFKYDQPVTTILGKLIVTKNAPKRKGTLDDLKKEGATEDVKEILIKITPVQKLVDYYVKEVKIAPTDKFSTVLELSLLNATPAKAIDYLNTIITLYNDAAIADKRFVSEKTSEFIDSRLVLITDELGDVEKNVEGYKARNSITDIPTELKIHLENANVYEKQIIENETELKVVSSLIEFLKNSKPNELLPGNIVATDVSSNSLINQYNTLVLERNKLSSSTTKLNPAIVRIEEQINSMKASVLESLLRAESSLKITRRELSSKENELRSKLSLVPKQEREFRIIDRQQKVKEAIYPFPKKRRNSYRFSCH